jgi:hypothetical protein
MPRQSLQNAKTADWVVGTTGIEPVTPTMSTQRIDGNYSENPVHHTQKRHKGSRSDQGNLGLFPGLYTIIQRNKGAPAVATKVAT